MTSWTSDRVRQLIGLWADGLKMTDIADQLGLTKNSVIGKLHRLQVVVPSNTVPILGSMDRLDALHRFSPNGRCAWPLGREIRAPDFHFCGKDVMSFDKSYCEEHHNIAWVKPKTPSKQIVL